MSIPGLFDERHAAQAAAYLLFRASGRLPLIKLLKLLYLAERLSFQRFGEPLTADALVSMEHGPVLSRVYNCMKGFSSREDGWGVWIADRENHDVSLVDPSMIRSPEQDLTLLSDNDLAVLSEVWSTYGHWDKWKLRDFTHEGGCPEWEDPNGSSKPIPYHRLFESLGFSPEDAEALEARLIEQSNISSALA